MGLKSDLEGYVRDFFKDTWSTRDGRVVPEPEDLRLSNDAVRLERATVLYADLTGSTSMVDRMKWHFAGEVYKSYLYCAAKLINDAGGEITSYDGDRVMGIFVGDVQTTSAVKCALKINYAVQNIINPALMKQYSSTDYRVKQVIGIDTSALHAARTGVHGGNDIVWIGRAANHAAKLTSLKEGTTCLTKAAYDVAHESAKFGGNPRQSMWEKRLWTAMNNAEVYRSNWTWRVD